jgi:3-oxoacyl-[acyl-carrier-protein] synthase-3
MRAKIVATGLYVPPKVETAAELAPRVGRTEEWILSQTGVERRHISEEPMEVMGARAAREALEDGPKPDLLINASTTPRQLIPDSAPFMLRELKLEGIACHTVHATCLSFLVAVHAAACYVTSGAYRRALVVSSEAGSVSRDFSEPESAVLIGDAAAAAVVEPTPPGEDSALLAYEIATWPKGAELTEFRGGGIRRHPNNPITKPADNLFHMNGPAVYKAARRRAAMLLQRVFRRVGFGPDEVALLVPHQASGPALEAIPDYGFAAERVVNIIAEYGNCIAASIPLALALANREGRLQRGDVVMLAGTGAGLSVGAALLRW